MKIITLPSVETSLRTGAQSKSIFDPVRKKHVVANPEELVRQAVIKYLIEEKNYPRSLIAVEASIKLHRLQKRCDIIVYKNSLPVMIVECKASTVKINQDVFDQIARYNLALQVPYLIVTNGIVTTCCKLELGKGNYEFLNNLPDYPEL